MQPTLVDVRLLVAGIFALSVMLPGCLSNTDASTMGLDEIQNESFSNDTVTLERIFSGIILYRLAGDTPPLSDYLGDSNIFCITVPEFSSNMHALLEWGPVQDMVLEMTPPEGRKIKTWSDENPVNPIPPHTLSIDEPMSGDWYIYLGPGAAGGLVEWELTLTWTVERGNATVEETHYDGLPCR